MVNVLELLDELDALGVRLDLTAGPGIGPRLRTDAPTGALTEEHAAAIREHLRLIVAVVIGRRTGHAPAPCDICGAVSLVAIAKPDGKRRTTWPTCRLTPGCSGRHVARQRDVDQTKPIAPPPQARPPARPPHRRLFGPWPVADWARPPAKRGVS